MRTVMAGRTDADDLFARIEAGAARRTGIREPADGDIRDGMRVLLAAFAGLEDLTRLGWLGTRAEIGRRLANSLRLRQVLRENPGIEGMAVCSPVVILGLPRTGTTLLHHLLACAQPLRAPRLWEFLYPRRPGTGPATRTIAVARAVGYVASSRWAIPELRRIHPIAANEPEECVIALPHSLYQYVRAPVRSYQDWLERGHDPVADYRYLRQQLQVLQGRAPDRRWVLKSPFHLLQLDALHRVFPDATFVWAHRDPPTAMASWCNLVKTVQLFHLRRLDPWRIGQDWRRIWSEGADKALRTRTGAKPGHFLDVSYSALTSDPLTTTQSLLFQLGISPGPDFKHHAKGVLRRLASRRGASHVYSPPRFGLNTGDIENDFAGYLGAASRWLSPAPASPGEA
jgi:hypothetical protein